MRTDVQPSGSSRGHLPGEATGTGVQGRAGHRIVNRRFLDFRGRRVLLLQGPVGPFFRRLAKDLKHAGAFVWKVNFNGGDWLYYPVGATAFRGRMESWPDFFERLLEEKKIDMVLLFGDCRPVHQAARAVADKLHVTVGVFEEGYIRPDYITFERSAVNGNSTFRRARMERPADDVASEPELSVGSTFWWAALWAMFYYLAAVILWPLFRRYIHHRPLNALQALPWVRSVYRKWIYKFVERDVQEWLTSTASKKFFLVPLQIQTDSQIRVHSKFQSCNRFLHHVAESFARCAPEDAVLVIKQHPLDRGYHDYSAGIKLLEEWLGLDGRIRYIHDQHLPTLLQHARGVVVINSTVGFSALHHGTPTKTLGNAIYDITGLTFQGSLDEFWRHAEDEPVDRRLYQRYRAYLVEMTQINGSFYRRLDVPGLATGLRWKALERTDHSAGGADVDEASDAGGLRSR